MNLREFTSAPAEEPHVHTWHENRRYCTPPTGPDTPDNTEQLAQM